MKIDKKEHDKKCKITKKLYLYLKNHAGNVDYDYSMEEWYFKYIVSKLTIKYLIYYDLEFFS